MSELSCADDDHPLKAGDMSFSNLQNNSAEGNFIEKKLVIIYSNSGNMQ